MHSESECSQTEDVRASIITAMTDMFDIIMKSQMEIEFSGL